MQNAHASTTVTITDLPYTYFHLVLHTSPSTATTTAAGSDPSASAQPTIDILTARTHLTAALQQYLGLIGTAIPIDFLKVSDGGAVWIRVPRQDAGAVQAALSQWSTTASIPTRTRSSIAQVEGPSRANGGDVASKAGAGTVVKAQVSWTVKGQSESLVDLVAGDGGDLFAS